MMVRKDTKLYGPDGIGYILTADLHSGDDMLYTLFEPFGGASKPEPLGEIPLWVWEELEKNSERKLT